MNPQEFLNQPTEVFVPNGYMACLNCNNYHHHPLLYCHKCGASIVRVKSMPFMEFIQRMRNGSGPLNTLNMALRRLIDKKDLTTSEGWSGSLSPEAQIIYDYARKHKTLRG
ncbi:MAG TPA: hypothetical protein VKH37_03525 [Ferruginibacter sp.]|nr:hypothetical protein [Ferruginibacter sp.]